MGAPVTNRDFYPLDEELHQDEAKFFNYLWISSSTFDKLLEHLEDSIAPQNNKMRNCMPPGEMLTLTIW
jgi:hypothetical protein